MEPCIIQNIRNKIDIQYIEIYVQCKFIFWKKPFFSLLFIFFALSESIKFQVRGYITICINILTTVNFDNLLSIQYRLLEGLEG